MGGIGRIICWNEFLPEAFSEELRQHFNCNLLTVRSIYNLSIEVVIGDRNNYSYMGDLVKKQAEEYVKF